MTNNYELAGSSYNSRQRIVCVTLGVAGTISLSTTATMAIIPAPAPHNMAPAPSSNVWQSHVPVGTFGHASPVQHNSTAWHFPGTGQSQSSIHQSGQNVHSAVTSLVRGKPSSLVQAVSPSSSAGDLNLASKNQSFLSNNIANFKDITIQVGGKQQVVSLGSKLTAAEVVAAEQVLTGGTQTIKLSSTGTATGGTITLNSSLLGALDASVGGSIGSLTISHGVKVVDTLSLLTVGSLSNYGSILTAAGTAGSSDTISAGTILNAAGGHIGSYSGDAAGGASTSNGLFAADPILNGLTSVTNNGIISSAGNLTINAPVVYNVASHGSDGTITAGQNINFNTQSLNNTGLIAALSGNVNVASAAALNVANAGGTLQAKSGNINFKTDSADINVTGGNLDSQQVNLKAGNGSIELTADNSSGQVNASGNNVHLYSASNLNLGNLDTSGDPTIASQGTITISGNSETTNGNNLAIVAAGNIISDGTGGIDTTQVAGNAGSLILVAGASFTGDGTTVPVVITDSVNAGHGTTAGGLIDLNGGHGGSGAVTSITTQGTGATGGNAGSIQMIAYAGTGAGSGTITTPGKVIINASSTSGNYADVTMYAGAKSGSAITTGSISSNNLTMGTFTPTAGSGVTIDITGSQTVGSFSSSGKVNAADINLFGNAFNTGNVLLNTGGVFTNAGFQFFSNVQNPQSGLNGGVGHNITINSVGDLTTGNIFAGGTGGAGSGSFTPGLAGGNGGNGGNISLTSSSGSVIALGVIDVSGGGGGGGAGGSESQNATKGGAGGIAGTITLNASQDVLAAGAITAYDGGAGGAGGSQVGGVGGGGGGGTAVGGGGGGGGGGLGTTKAEFGAGGGGGFSSAGSGGGGAGSFDNKVNGGVPSTGGGGGGNFFGNGLGGTGNVNGINAGGPVPPPGGGGGGLGAAPGLGGTGAVNISAGGGGGQSDTAGQGVGGAGGIPQVIAGHGVLNIFSGGIASGKTGDITTPISVEVGTLNYNLSVGLPTTGASANILSQSGTLLTVGDARAGATGTVQIASAKNSPTTGLTGGAITTTGNLQGATVTITTGGSSVAAGANDITISNTNNAILGGTAILTAGNNGKITTTSNGTISTTTATLTAPNAINVATSDTNLTAVSTGSSVTINQVSNSLTLNLGTSSSASGSAFTVTAANQLNIIGAITAPSSTVQLTAGTGTTSGGIDVGTGGSITASGAAGAISLTAGTTGSLTDSKGGTLTANAVTLTAVGGNIGTAALPILTNATSVTGKSGASGSLAVTDATNSGTFTFDAQSKSTGTLTLNSAAPQLNIIEAPYSSVAINDATTLNANVLLNSGNSKTALFGGSGTFSVTASGNIDVAANTTPITGSSVSLTSTTGSVGSARQIATAAGQLNLSAVTGFVNVTDSVATSSVTGAAKTTFTLQDTAVGGTGLTITSPITGATIALSTTASGIAVNASLGSATSAVTVDSGTTLSQAKSTTITGTTVVLDGTNDSSVTPTVSLLGTVSGSTSVQITGTNNSGTAVSLGGPVTGPIITVTGKGSVADIQLIGAVGTSSSTVNITTAGNIVGSKTGSVAGSTVNLTSTGGSIGSSGQAINTAATPTGILTANASSGGGSFLSQTGDVILGTSSGGTLSLTVAGNLEVSKSISSGIAVTLTTTKGAITVDAGVNIGGAAANTMLLSDGDLTLNNGNIQGSLVKMTSVGNFLQNAGSDVIGNAVTVSSGGTFTANGAFDSSGIGSSLQLSSTGVFTTGSASALGTKANPFDSVIVNPTGNSTSTINGQVNATGVALNGGLQFLTKGASANLVISSTAVLNDSSDLLKSSGTTSIDGVINDTALQITSTGAVTVGGVAKAAAIITTKGVSSITAPSFTNSGSVNGSTSETITTTAAGSALTNNSGGTIGGGTVSLSDSSTTANTITNAGAITGVTSATLSNSSTTGILNNSGTISVTGSGAGTAIALTSANVTNSGTGTIGGTTTNNTINIQTASLNNTSSGNISAAQQVIIGNAAGNLTIAGTNGTITSGNGGSLSLSAKSLITAGNSTSNPLSALSAANTFNSVTVTAGGNFTSPLTGITVSPDGKGNGGTINVTASNVTFNGTGSLVTPFALNANGTTGIGGNVTLNLSGTATTGLTVGALAGNYSILANGQTGGGTVSLTTPGQLTLNTAAANFNINATNASGTTGSNVTLAGTKGVLIKGDLDTHTGSGTPGNIKIISGSALTFNIDGRVATTLNGQTSTSGTVPVTLAGDNVTITNTAGVTVGIGDTLSGATSITVNGNALTNNGAVNTKNLTIAATGTALVNSGSGSFLPLDSLTVSSATGGITLSGPLPSPATDINLTALKGTISFGKLPATLTAQADSKGNGGIINISAKTLTSAALALSAPATTGVGGTVNIQLTGTTAIKVGTGAITINVANASGKAGGNVTIVNGGNVTVDGNALTLGTTFPASGGANLTLAGKVLHISNASKIDAPGELHNVSLTSNSASFTAGGAASTANGIGDPSTTFSADNLTIINNGGTIIKGTNTGLNGVNSLTLKTKTDIGQVGVNKSLIVSAPTASLIAGGSLYVNDTTAVATLTALQALTTLQFNGVAVTAPGAVNAKTLNITTTGSFTPFTTTATLITANIGSGDLAITDSATALLTLNAIKSTAGNVTISSNGAITAAGAINAITAGKSISITSNGALITKTAGVLTAGSNVTLIASGTKGSISEGANITGGAAGTISLTANGTGTIIDAGTGTYQASAGTVDLTTNGTNIGTTTAGFRTGNAPATAITIDATTGLKGAVNITNKDTQAAGIVNFGTANVGSLKLTATNTLTTNTGTLNIGTINAQATTGAILVTTSEQTLNVGVGANLSTFSGNITLQNTHVGSGVDSPLIAIGNNAVIHASTPSTLKTAGNVFIALGTVPTASTVRAGVPPLLNPPDISGSTTPLLVTYGSTTNLSGSITTSPGDAFNSKNRNLSFNTGATNKATQITVGTGVTITADPPSGPDSSSASIPSTSIFLPAVNTAQQPTGSSITVSSANIVGSSGNITASSGNIAGSGGNVTESSSSNVGLQTAIFNSPATSSTPATNGSINSGSLTNTALTSGLLNGAALGTAGVSLGNGSGEFSSNLGAAVSNNAVNSLNPLFGFAQTTQTSQTGQSPINQLKSGPSFVGKTLKGSASNVAHQSLDQGVLLLTADENSVVDTPYGSVNVAAGSLALLVAFDNGLAVYDLHDGHKGAVVIHHGDQSTALLPGHSAVLTRSSDKSFEQLNPTPFVAYRQLASRNVGNDTKVYQAQFDIISMVRGVKPLRDMFSSDSAKARKVMANLLKTAVILSQLVQDKEQFSLYVAPPLTAYAPSAHQ